ncbi:MAG TPA: NDP-sugar synthase [Acidimicrobiales bacterium]|nr:NDP-sugar synthase [Acidimicrobiales bacterium]
MKAIVLVGGEGTRLRPLTYTTPKQLLPVAGVPMLERAVAHLARHGVDEVILSMGYKADAFLAAYPDGHCAGVPVRYVVEAEPLDTGGAIAYAADETAVDDRFLVVNSDVLTDMDYSALIMTHAATGALTTIGLTPVEDPSRFGVVVTDSDGRVTAFIEKPAPGTAPTNLINAGIYVMEPAALEVIERGRRVSVEREVFPAMVERGVLYAAAVEGYWIDIGNPAAYVQANLDIAGRSVIDATAKVEPSAVVIDSVVQANAFVGANAVVDRSVIGVGATVGVSASVREFAVVGPGATVPDFAEVVGGTVE